MIQLLHSSISKGLAILSLCFLTWLNPGVASAQESEQPATKPETVTTSDDPPVNPSPPRSVEEAMDQTKRAQQTGSTAAAIDPEKALGEHDAAAQTAVVEDAEAAASNESSDADPSEPSSTDSVPDSGVALLVVPTDEERSIAEQTAEVVAAPSTAHHEAPSRSVRAHP